VSSDKFEKKVPDESNFMIVNGQRVSNGQYNTICIENLGDGWIADVNSSDSDLSDGGYCTVMLYVNGVEQGSFFVNGIDELKSFIRI
jgi:hypothetical protein